ncbi:MAG TPA: LysM peptidoglycan-binding domain-containing protein, partial [Anaerolineae bacterium]
MPTYRTFCSAVITCLLLTACAKSSTNPFPTAGLTTPVGTMPATTVDPAQGAQTPGPSDSTAAPVRQPRTLRNPAPLRDVVASDADTGSYTVQDGDMLSRIASAVGSPVAALQRLNKMGRSTDISAGETLQVPLPLQGHAPSVKLIPDSELVNSPTAAKFDMAQFMAQHPNGYLNRYTEKFDGQELSGPDIVERIAEELSVHPRLLLALLEYEGGWVDNPSPSGDRLKYPLGIKSSARRTLSKQLSWAGARLNEGYYGWRLATRLWVQFTDNDYTYMGTGVNAGTAGLQNYLAAISTRQSFPGAAGDGARGFIQTYKDLFGDPWQFDLGVLAPDNLQQPPMTLPWAKGD